MKLAVALVRAWTACYTWRLPSNARAARRQEIESDLWESLHGEGPRASSTSLVMRLLLGMSDDLAWRHEQSRHRVPVLALAMTIAVLAGLVWVMGRPTALPTPEPLRRSSRLGRIDPPPPPPPPPCPPPGLGYTAPSPCAPFR